MSATAKITLTLEGIGFGYDRERNVLQALDLTLYGGEVTAILGPNGSGKTTLLQLLLGRLSPRHGSILINGKTRADHTRSELSRLIGLVAQEEEAPFEFTVSEYVVMGRAPYLAMLEMPTDEDYQIAGQAIDQIGVRSLAERTVPSLSGGERQMVRLARALAQQPSILLLDEPTNHLDLSNRGRVLSVMRESAAAGGAVIFTTHDPAAAAAVARRMVLLRDGQVLAAGPVDEVFTGKNLSAVYGTPLRVRRVEGEWVVLGG